MRLLSILFSGIFSLGISVSPAYACAYPPTMGESTGNVSRNYTMMVPHPSKRTLVNQVRSMRRKLPTTVKGF